MNRFLSDKCMKQSWWEWPVMIGSGVLTAIGIRVVAETFTTEDFIVSAVASLLVLGFLSWPLFVALKRRLRRAQAVRLAKCLEKVHGSSITFGELTRRTGIGNPEGKLQWMIGKGWLKNIAVDVEHVSVRLLGETEEASEESAGAEEPVSAVPETGNEAFNAKLREIRELNERIDDRAVSDKIDRIEDLTADIFKLIAEHPDRAGEVRRFMNYYLPTTFKLLESYSLMEKQRYQGDSIRESRQRIEAVLDQIIQAIERQQDKLFQTQALDVETDISVLQTMMSADGLAEDGGLHVKSQGGRDHEHTEQAV